MILSKHPDKTAERAAILARLTAPGTRFEIGVRQTDGYKRRYFVNAPPSTIEIAEDAARLYGELPYLVSEERRISFSDTLQEAQQLAASLQRLFDIGRGDHIGIAMRNRIEWVITSLASAMVGAVTVALNAWWTGAEMASACNDADIKLLIADSDRFYRLAGSGLDQTIPIICVDDVALAAPPVTAYGPLAAHAIKVERAQAKPDDPAMIFYTSGSSATPKAVMLTHQQIVQTLESWTLDAMVAAEMHSSVEPTAQQPAALVTIPFFHVSGHHVGALGGLHWGRKTVLMRRWDVEEALDIIDRENITHLSAPATITGDLVHAARVQQRALPSLRALGGGGASRPASQVRAIAATLPMAAAGTGWGMTETSALGTGIAGLDYANRPDSCGQASAIMDMKIVAPDGSEVAIGASGELCVRGVTVISEYWHRPTETAASFSDGWFHTGDVARFDKDGYLYIVGRIKDMIVRGGENISCAQIETAIVAIEDVIEAAVFAVPDERLGEEIGAVVVVGGKNRPGSCEIRSALTGRLARFQLPRYILCQTDRLPRIASGKIAIREVRKHALKAIALAAPETAG